MGGNPASIPGPARPHPGQVNLPLSQWLGQAPGLRGEPCKVLVRHLPGTQRSSLRAPVQTAARLQCENGQLEGPCLLSPVLEQRGCAIESR